MTERWSFHNPVRIHAAPGVLAMLPELLRGTKGVLLVSSPGFRRRGGVERVEQLLVGRRVHVLDDISPNPELGNVEDQLARFGSADIDDIVAIGGGSVLDTAKILAAGIGSSVSLRRHLFEGEPLPARRVRLVCVPTTAGTGSEVTPFATVWDQGARRKLSVSGETMFPDVALLDPELTLSLPEEVTVATGLDAITQAFEATWSRRANAVTTTLAVGSLRAALGSLPRLLREPGSVTLRGAMLEASLLAGLAISHTRTALCHSISYPLTAHFGVPHGLACAFTLPEVFAFNCAADPVRSEEVARALGFAAADELERAMAELLDSVGLGRCLTPYLRNVDAVAALVAEMLTPGRADNNMREANLDDVDQIVRAAWRGRGLAASREAAPGSS